MLRIQDLSVDFGQKFDIQSVTLNKNRCHAQAYVVSPYTKIFQSLNTYTHATMVYTINLRVAEKYFK